MRSLRLWLNEEMRCVSEFFFFFFFANMYQNLLRQETFEFEVVGDDLVRLLLRLTRSMMWLAAVDANNNGRGHNWKEIKVEGSKSNFQFFPPFFLLT